MGKNSASENKIAAKLRSERGASITFALLLFLVCAALSAVILVAATTASGRMAGIAETDQRYYSVTSASELFADILNGKTVTRVVLSNEEIHYIEKPALEVTEADFKKNDQQNKSEPDIDIDAEKNVEDIDSTVVSGALSSLEPDSFLGSLVELALNDGESATGSPWNVTSSVGEGQLAISIQPAKKGNDIVLAISNKDDSEKYTLNLKFNLFKGPAFEKDNKTGEWYYTEEGSDKRIVFPLKKVGSNNVNGVREIRLNLDTIQSLYDENTAPPDD